jgi:hypothetical protein
MSNRLYIVNTETNEYCCIAKCFDYSWSLGNTDLLSEFLSFTSGFNEKRNIVIGSEQDEDFFKAYIENGININKENKWKK